MAYICSSCNKFASVDIEEVNPDVDLQGSDILFNADLSLTSQCCGVTVATASVEDLVSFDEEGFEHEETCVEDEREYSATLAASETTDWYDGKPDKNGKMPPLRYQRHYYGLEGSVTITCEACQAEQDVEFQIGEQASAFEAY